MQPPRNGVGRGVPDSLRWTPQSSADPVHANKAGVGGPLKPSDPTELGGIALRGRLGQGGMGTVYFGAIQEGGQGRDL